MKKVFCVCLASLFIIFLLPLTVSTTALADDVPYDTYGFNYWGEEVLHPHTYLYSRELSSAQFGTTLKYPSDMCLSGSVIYIADTGNSRILKVDLSGNLLSEITYAENAEDTLNSPQGVYVTEEGHLYVADSGNERIVEYSENGDFVRAIGRPETTLISDSQAYTPVKVVVDNAGRIYAIAYGINMGLVEFDKNGVFQGFMGATEVQVSYFTYIWKNYFSTAAQQERMETIVPTEYSNIFVDDEGFIYATINNLSDEDHEGGADAIRRLNPTGTDVLRRLGNYDIVGDLNTENWSSFCDVAATDFGCYYVLDDSGGKVFAYDYDGNSLFAFGGIGVKEGNVQKPVAIALSDDLESVYILDNLMGSILEFKITDFGRHIMNALYLNDAGDSDGATAEWTEVLESDSNYELAYIGLGKSYLAEGEYKKAVDYFELGNSRKYYTNAFYYYRKELMEDHFGTAMLVIIIILAAYFVVKWIVKFKRWVGKVRCSMLNQSSTGST